MSEKLKIVLGVVIGIVCAVMLFCLIIVVACSVNGLTFSEQISEVTNAFPQRFGPRQGDEMLSYKPVG